MAAPKAKKNRDGKLVCKHCGSRVNDEKTAYCSERCEELAKK